MIRIGEKYIRGTAVNMIRPGGTLGGDPDNWSTLLMEDGTWVEVNAPAAVVVDRVRLDEICVDINCKEDHDG